MDFDKIELVLTVARPLFASRNPALARADDAVFLATQAIGSFHARRVTLTKKEHAFCQNALLSSLAVQPVALKATRQKEEL